MDILIIHKNDPNCRWCGGDGECRQIVDHDEYGPVYSYEKCHCERHEVLVDGNPVENVLIALGYKK